MMRRFEGKTVLITGASSGLGKACAKRLAAEGASLVLIGRNPETLDQSGVNGGKHVCDLTDEAAVKALLAKLKEQSGNISGWVLAAGVQDVRPLRMESQATLQNTWAINVQGTLGFLALALKSRIVEAGGSIVLFYSAAVHAGGIGLVSYAASKGAIEAATRSLALELAAQKIRVNAVAPGVIPTPMSDKYLSKMTPDAVASIEALHPLGFGKPEDVAGPVAFLLSEDARWITGSVLAIDGGLSIH
ncbi:MAG: SDR family oxidoreductase [Acidobacteriota bacterium]|nr:SDR family oxidoreductase [Acidobacteriota bacterium]